MNYTCPTCKRTILGPNHYHSCFVTDKATHMAKMNDNVADTLNLLLSHLTSFDNIEVVYLKTCIQFKIGATFLSVYTKKDRLDLHFQLTREENEFPIYRCQKLSKNRVLHRIAVEAPIEIDNQLKEWLLEAYQTIKK